MASQKIAVYSLSDLKNTTDDALPNYLKSLNFKQNHLLTDVRLGLGYGAVAIAAATFYYDHKSGWDATKDITFWAVLAYFVLNGALTLWIWGFEKGNVFNGSKEDVTISCSSSVPKHTPIYRLTVRFTTPGKPLSSDWKRVEIQAPFTTWFTEHGHFVAKPFQEWLASKISIINEAAASRQEHAAGTFEDSKPAVIVSSAFTSTETASKPRKGKN